MILAAPSTDATKTMIGADELAAMKPSAWLINIARGDMIDEEALLAALNGRKIAGAFLDPTHPEPLPADHPLWSAPNCMITMHLSGRSQTKMFPRAAALFLRNLAAFVNGRPMENVVDLERAIERAGVRPRDARFLRQRKRRSMPRAGRAVRARDCTAFSID